MARKDELLTGGAGMRRWIAAAITCVTLAVGGLVGVAGAVDEHAPHGGATSHPHHVHTGDGGCHDIDEVTFEHDSRGLHRGAAESGVSHGPWHGTCASHVHR